MPLRLLTCVLVVALLLSCANAGPVNLVYSPTINSKTVMQFMVRGELSLQLSDRTVTTFNGGAVTAVNPASCYPATTSASFQATLQTPSGDSTQGSEAVVLTFGFDFVKVSATSYTWMLTELSVGVSDSTVLTALSKALVSSSSSVVAAASSAKFSCADSGAFKATLFDSDEEVAGSLTLSNFTLYGAAPCAYTAVHSLTKCSLPSICADSSLETYYCADKSADGNSSDESEKEEEGFGGFFVFLLIVFMLYCVIGVAYKRFVAKAEGIDQLPNSALWVGLANACGNCASFVRGGCKRSPTANGWALGSSEPPPYDW